MVLLNGECGGIYPYDICLSPVLLEDGTEEPAKIRDLIVTALTEIGGIPRHKIFIFDLPDRIKNTTKWSGSKSLWVREGEKDTDGNSV
jgi:hypothetical protein